MKKFRDDLKEYFKSKNGLTLSFRSVTIVVIMFVIISLLTILLPKRIKLWLESPIEPSFFDMSILTHDYITDNSGNTFEFSYSGETTVHLDARNLDMDYEVVIESVKVNVVNYESLLPEVSEVWIGAYGGDDVDIFFYNGSIDCKIDSYSISYMGKGFYDRDTIIASNSWKKSRPRMNPGELCSFSLCLDFSNIGIYTFDLEITYSIKNGKERYHITNEIESLILSEEYINQFDVLYHYGALPMFD